MSDCWSLGSKQIKKKIAAASQPEKLIRVRSEDILNKPLSREQRQELAALAEMPDSEIDYSDAPDTSENHLRQIKRLVLLNVDSDVLAWWQKTPGYQTRINLLLRREMIASIEAQAGK